MSEESTYGDRSCHQAEAGNRTTHQGRKNHTPDPRRQIRTRGARIVPLGEQLSYVS